MLDKNFIEAVNERDIDLLLLEELTVSEEFRKWFSTLVFGGGVYQSAVRTWHSVSVPGLGESDLVFVFKASDGQRAAVLLEDKIDAPPQPEQGERYQLRGKKGRDEGLWAQFRTCIVAPQAYFDSVMHSEEYDAEVSYEEIEEYFSRQAAGDERLEYKARLVREGIEQNRRGSTSEPNREMTQFVRDYYDFAQAEFAHLGMQEAGPRSVESTWMMFHPPSLASKTGLWVTHQTYGGAVKVIFAGKAGEIDQLKAEYGPRLTEGMVIEKAKKSAAIRMKVPKLRPLEDTFAEQREKVREALECLSRIVEVVA